MPAEEVAKASTKCYLGQYTPCTHVKPYILQLLKTTPLSYLEGELFKADVTCDNEGGNGKLFFKYSGTRNLLENGKQLSKMLAIGFYDYCIV